jgi:hypothetical protein
VPRLPALLSRRPERGGVVADGPIPMQRTTPMRERTGPLVISRGPDVLRLLDVAPPSAGLRPGSLVLGFAVGAMVANRRRVR